MIDRNGIQQDGLTEQIMPLEPLAAKWRAFNWKIAAEEFRKHGYEVIDYDTSVKSFEKSGLPVEDTHSSRDKYADLAQALAVDAIVIPYYGTQFTSKNYILVNYFNAGQMIHPIHLHGPGQLVIAKDGYPLTNPEMEDTITVAPGERYTVLIHPDQAGVWVWHCHILSHAETDQGMYGMVTALVVQ